MNSPRAVMSTPRSADISITDRCNLRCSYCSHFSSASETGTDLPTGEWLRFFDELGRCGVMRVTLQGGEPFCREDLPELIAGIVKNRMRYSILTNGTLVTGAMAAELALTRRCESVQVSIDGSIPLTHDAFRGKGNFDKAIRGLEALQSRGIPVTVRVTIHRKNVHDLENIARLLLEEIGLPSFSTNAASHMGLCRKNSDMLQLTAEEHVVAMESLLRLLVKYGSRITANAGPLADARMWRAMEEARSQGRESLEGRGSLTGCNGPSSTIAVRSDGVMVPCCQISHLPLGRINSDDLQQVWQSHPELWRLRERHAIPLESFELCRGCAYIRYCSGGCPALAYTTFGQENHPSPDGCLRLFLQDGGRLPREAASAERCDE
jgi:SynChlorMet cassette radical SAM/SPASM protein ScmE